MVPAPERHPLLPEVPTAAEAGLQDFIVTSWQAVVAPAGVSPTLLARIQREVVAALQHPETVERMARIGFTVATGTPEEFRAFQAQEIARHWRRVVQAAGIKPGIMRRTVSAAGGYRAGLRAACPRPSRPPGDGCQSAPPVLIPNPADRLSGTYRLPAGAVTAVTLINRIPYEQAPRARQAASRRLTPIASSASPIARPRRACRPA